MAGTVEQKLAEQGIVLHEPASPIANYVGFVRTGNLLFVSGQVCVNAEGKLIAKGKLGAGVTTPSPGSSRPLRRWEIVSGSSPRPIAASAHSPTANGWWSRWSVM